MSADDTKTAVCSVVFLDLVGYSKLPGARQSAAKARFNEALARIVDTVAESERIVLDTGDGAALCFLGDPEAAIDAAGGLAALFGAGTDFEISLRIGVNLGPVQVVMDVNRRRNVVGDGINVAQRIMSFAGENQILVSRSYYDVVAHLREENAARYRFLGQKHDKHGRSHEVYSFEPADAHRRAMAASRIDPDALRAIEERVIRRLGPLGRVIVARAAAVSTSIEGVLMAISVGLPDDPSREALLVDLRNLPGRADRAVSGAGFGAADIAQAERSLADYIGPLASVLVRRAAQDAEGKADFLHRLSEHIADRGQKAAFLASFEL